MFRPNRRDFLKCATASGSAAATLVVCSNWPVPAVAGDKPFFEFRAWESQVEGVWFDPPGTKSLWYKSPRYLAYLEQLLAEAPKYDVNTLVLMGRFSYCEVPTFISYRKWPKLHAVYEEQGRQDRELQVEQLNRLVEKANSRGIGVYVWTHELHLPSGLTKNYPELAGMGATFCPSQPELWEFVASKYDEFFDRVPGVAGMFLVLSETQVPLLGGSPCQCERCKRTAPDALLEKLIRAVDTPFRKRGKRLIVRTHCASREETRTICAAINRLPKDIPLTVMSKAIENDWVGVRYPDDQTFTLINDRPKVLEESCGEYRGKTNIIHAPAGFYRQRVRTAARNGVRGLVMRLDHNGFAKNIFETPNLFNIHFLSQLWRDPDADPDEIWKGWFEKRYGAQAAPLLISAFKNTENIWEWSTNTLGVYTVSAHGNLAPLFQRGYSAWFNLNFSVFQLTKGYPEWDKLGTELLRPSDDTLARIKAEIEQANHLADGSLKLVRQAGEHLSPRDAKELQYYFGVFRHAARMFGQLKMLFFLGLQAEQSDGARRAAKIEHALDESRTAIRVSWDIERDFGPGHWPLTPDDLRGSEFSVILEDYWTQSMAGLILQGKIPRGMGPRPSAAGLWHDIFDVARPGRPRQTQPREFCLDKAFQSMEFADRSVLLTTSDGHRLCWPVGRPVAGPKLIAGWKCQVTLQRENDGVLVVAAPPGD